MTSPEERQPNEYETMDTLSLLRAYHKASTRLNQLRDTEVRTFETGKAATMGQEWDQLIKQRDQLTSALSSKGAIFGERGIDIGKSSDEIKKLVAENGPE